MNTSDRITQILTSIYYNTIQFNDDTDRVQVINGLEEARSRIVELEEQSRNNWLRALKAERNLRDYKNRREAGNRPRGRTE